MKLPIAGNPSQTTLDRKFSVHSIFLTLQGEGRWAGQRSVFVRFSGCNVWNGREPDRDKGAENSLCALICDTEFFGHDLKQRGGLYTHGELLALIDEVWGTDVKESPFVVFTGGEPGLQLTQGLVYDLQNGSRAYVAVETNGSKILPDDIDWVCVSPKPPMPLVAEKIDEIKVLYPLYDPRPYLGKATYGHLLQPVDVGKQSFAGTIRSAENLKKSIAYCKENPQWRLSIQQHKILGLP
jgi:7-carboxy-7-deazaguanine synthase